jgi:tRNA (guanosine-2'-O-)-methyltransferase
VKAPDPKDLLLSARKQRVDAVVAARTRSLVVVLDDLVDPHNVAAVLRTCEALGVQEVHAISRAYAFQPNPKITQGSEKWLDLFLHRDPNRCLDLLSQRGFVLCGTDLGENATSLLDLPIDRPLALLFGTEKVGLSRDVLARCDLRFKIPMLGFSQSLNVSVAAGICVSHVVFERMRRCGSPGDLSPTEQASLRQRFYALSVRQRHRLFQDLLAKSDLLERSPNAASNRSEKRK